MKHVESLRGLEVVVSGDFRQSLGLQKDELVRRIRRVGAAHVGTDVRSTTDLFVRGASALYKYGQFGDKEAELAALNLLGTWGPGLGPVLTWSGMQAGDI
jgi:hypothetical protein